MLGWDVQVYRLAGDEKILVARWTTSVFGIGWIDQLVKENKATDLGGDGYPCRYSARADVLLPVITTSLPPNQSPLVFGEDYALPAGWSGSVVLHRENIAKCRDDEELLVEAWDQS